MKQTNKANEQAAKSNASNAMNQVKMEAASEMGVTLNPGYNGDITSKEAGSIGGQMVKKMLEGYGNSTSETMNQYKMEAASEVGVPLTPGDNGNLTARQAGSIGGQMVKNMIKDYESKNANS